MSKIARDILGPFALALLLCLFYALSGPSAHSPFFIVVVAELGFATACARRMTAIRFAEAPVPFAERIPLIPFALGATAYCAIGLDAVPGWLVPIVGFVAACLIVASKLWVSRARFSPWREAEVEIA